MGLRDIGATLPPGFRFYPSDEELVCHYLYKKIANEDVSKGTLMEIDLHTCEPWQLPEVAKLNSSEWYFFSFRDRKYATGYRTNRATISGYWKATGKDRTVADPRTRVIVGMRKTLVFYKNRAPNGIKTGWIMHEFRLENPHIPPKEDWVLCRVFYKAKGENSNELSPPQSTYENFTAGANSPPNLGASSSHSLAEVYQTLMPSCGYNYQNNQISCSSNFSQSPPQNPNNLNTNFLATLSPYNPNFLQLSRGGSGVEDADPMADDIIMSSSTRCDQDQYGFMFDMGFEDSHHLGFDDDEEDDNGRVFF